MLANEKLRPKANGRNVRTPADCSSEPNGRFDGPRGVVGRLGDRQSSAVHTFKDGHSSQFCRAGFLRIADACAGCSERQFPARRVDRMRQRLSACRKAVIQTSCIVSFAKKTNLTEQNVKLLDRNTGTVHHRIEHIRAKFTSARRGGDV